jgi:hypothetical protein
MGLMDFELGDIGNVFTSIREAITGEKIKDPAEMAKISLQLSQLEQMANQGQISINKIEAAHKSLFVAGWRPFIGWVCGVAIAYAFVGQPLIEWGVAIANVTTDIITVDADGVKTITKELVKTPIIDSDTLYQLVLAMLGMATLRTYEKKNSVSREK